MSDVFSALNSVCVGFFGESVEYKSISTDSARRVLGIPEMDGDEEQHHDAMYVRFFFNLEDLAQTPEHGDGVSVPADASPLNGLGGPRTLPAGSSWTVYESLVDPVRGAYVRLRKVA